ncbi:MAG: RluA family pseudouridine synthase [Planctomycetes bacterium]|nr:RluA family pseudouridine synthase [Planctomycetota bacterium]
MSARLTDTNQSDDGNEPLPTPCEETELIEPAEADGFRRACIEIHRTLTNRRLDKYLAGRLGKLASRTSLQAYIKAGAVTVNGRVVKPSYTIMAGDRIDMLLREPETKTIVPEPFPIDVLYEDDDIIAVNKQAGLIVHPARGNWTGTLLNGMAWYFQQHASSIGDLPVGDEAYRPGIIHRLDRDTTGVILLAKSEQALWRIGRQFEQRRVHKTYLAIVNGHLELDEDVIDIPIGQHPRIKEKYAVDRRTGRAFTGVFKSAVTRYRVMERLGGGETGRPAFSLLELKPTTGRTHQIRVHTSYIGHPIVGDSLYGGGPLYRSQLQGRGDNPQDAIITRQALHAFRIEFQHPRTLKQIEIEAPPPGDFVAALDAIRGLKA